MKKGGQGAKGGAYERALTELFTKAYYPDGDGEFQRVPRSGAWDERIVGGDIMAFKYAYDGKLLIDQSFPLSVEGKNWRDENVSHFFTGLYCKEESEFFLWMAQSVKAAEKTKKMPLVAFKLYRQENVAMMRSEDFWKISQMFGSFPGPMYMMAKMQPATEESSLQVSLVFMLLKDFLEWIDWQTYKLADKTRYIRSILRKDEG